MDTDVIYKRPMASPKPMHRKARKTGNVLFFIDFKYQYNKSYFNSNAGIN